MGINEALLLISLPVIFGSVLLFYSLFGKSGLYAYTVVATLAANIEVLILVRAFGLEMTLGNVLFASTFLVTDILSETENKAAANRAVWLGLAATMFFLLVSLSWQWYIPATGDLISPALKTVFTSTPRMILSGLAVYAITQFFDVWVYHRFWDMTTRWCGQRDRFLWLRNNVGTILSQLINAVLFNILAFWGIYSGTTLVNIILSTFLIYVITSLADTPFVYAARRIALERKKKQEMIKEQEGETNGHKKQKRTIVKTNESR